ncbi:unnamed protein product [Toxocara canis]|uniref:Equilibrative nucleoside transporter 1 n=1 Tax=Toxocara canis TaxID=6265 RepID=A0A183UHT3_TOXCA|nr:unnamed protein product [Toxocara canis]
MANPVELKVNTSDANIRKRSAVQKENYSESAFSSEKQNSSMNLSFLESQDKQRTSKTSSETGTETDGKFDKEPEDHFHIVYLTMMLHGVGVLIPWSSFMTIAPEYYVCFKLREITSFGSAETIYAKDFLKYLATASQGPNLLLNVMNLFFTFRSGLTARIFICVLIMFLICALTMAFIFVDTSLWIGTFFWITMMLVVVLNAAGGLYLNSLFGIAADLPPNMTASITVGNNLSGVLCALVAIVTRAAATSSQKSAMAYFTVALVLVAACGLSFLLLRKSEFYQYYVNKVGRGKVSVGKESMGSLKSESEELSKKLTIYRIVLEKAWIQFLNIWMVLFVTLSIYPAIQAEVRPRDNFIIPREYFELVTTFFNFALFAMCGAMVSNWIQWPPPRFLIVATSLRLLFIPFFLACNYRPNSRRWPILIKSEWAFIIGGALMAFSSGYLSTLGMMYAPRVVHPSKSRSAGMMASLIFVVGLCSGIGFTYVEAYLMENVGPLAPLQVSDATGDMW